MMDVFVIVGHCDPGLCYDDNCHTLQQGGAPPIATPVGKPRLHRKPQTLRGFRRFHGELSQMLMSLCRNQNQNWQGAETLRAAGVGKVVEDNPGWRGGGFQYCKLEVLGPDF